MEEMTIDGEFSNARHVHDAVKHLSDLSGLIHDSFMCGIRLCRFCKYCGPYGCKGENICSSTDMPLKMQLCLDGLREWLDSEESDEAIMISHNAMVGNDPFEGFKGNRLK